MLRPLRLPAVLTALALSAVLAPGTAAAATPRPGPPFAIPAVPAVPAAAVPRSASPGTTLAPPPSSAELDAQTERQKALLDEEEGRLVVASREAATALEGFQVAQRQAEEAARQAADERQRLAESQQATVAAREQLADYIGTLYRTGMGNRKLSLYSAALDSRSPQRLFSGLGLAERVGGRQRDAVVAMGEAEKAQEASAARAVAAEEAQRSAEAQAAMAHASADILVAQAHDRVAARAAALLSTQDAAAAALEQEQRGAALLTAAELIALLRSEAPDTAVEGALVPRPLAECKGRDTRGYPNGMIPAVALCPLWGTRAQILRADAAAAFNDMSKAYAKVFGSPICVTDSYRSYAGQVAVTVAKPDLAAQPGSSNHGWGVSSDLCDGIESYDSDTHRWMKLNSMLFGWFLPGWAQQNGPKPEPWHWEFAG